MYKQYLKTIMKPKPIRMWIDGKCFNLNQYNWKQKKEKIKVNTTECVPAESNKILSNYKNIDGKSVVVDNKISECGDSNSKLIESNIKTFEYGSQDKHEDSHGINDIQLDTDSKGNLFTSFELPLLYYTKLKQNRYANLAEIKSRTKTDISIPHNEEPGKLVISGCNGDNIKEALNEIHCVLGQIRAQAMALQFLAVPLTSDEIKTNFEKFKNEILSETELRGMHESIFQKPSKLHLTIDIFVLLSESEKAEAIRSLEDYKESVLKPVIEKSGPLKMHVSGIDCMNEDYENVHVLYAKAKIVNETDEVTLQSLVNGISAHFYDRGFLKKHQESVKLHMTLINTKYRKEPGTPKRRWAKRKSIDARKIMKKYKDYEFGQCDLNSIHIANISTLGKDGFYEVLGTVEF